MEAWSGPATGSDVTYVNYPFFVQRDEGVNKTDPMQILFIVFVLQK